MDLPVVKIRGEKGPGFSGFSRAKFTPSIILPDTNTETPKTPDHQQNQILELNNNDDPLRVLDNDVFISPIETEKQIKQREKEEKQREKEERKREREIRKKEMEEKRELKRQAELEMKEIAERTRLADEKNYFEETGEHLNTNLYNLYLNRNDHSEQAEEDDQQNTEEDENILLGRDRLFLTAEINRYKALFPEIKKIQQLKIKTNHSADQLQAILEECKSLVEVGNLENFITDSIFEIIKMAELYSTVTKYNITGLSDSLKNNPKFHFLAKQLYIKYNTFRKIPVEYQMALLIFATTYGCIQANKVQAQYSDLNNIQVNPNDLYRI